jgi:LmbE family N-acetylglucosaminyl deacetylase
MVSASHEEEWETEIATIAKHLGATHVSLDFHEGAIFDDPSHLRRIVAALREHRPDLVITHQPTDYHRDHRALSRAVLGACLLSRVAEIKTDHSPHKIGNLYYSDTTSGVNSAGSIYVDVAKTWQQKIEALRLHKGLSEKQSVPPPRQHRAPDRAGGDEPPPPWVPGRTRLLRMFFSSSTMRTVAMCLAPVYRRGSSKVKRLPRPTSLSR